MDKPSKSHMLRQLFFSSLRLSAFTFGGGYVIVSLMRKRFVEQLHWIDEDEMLDLVAVAQSSPGPIAVNASLMVGYHVAGVWGAALSVLGTVIPPLITISAVSYFYSLFRSNPYVGNLMLGMQAGVAAVIVSVVIDLGKDVTRAKNAVSTVLMCAAFVLVYFFKVSVVYIMLGGAVIGLITGFIIKKRKSAEDGDEKLE